MQFIIVHLLLTCKCMLLMVMLSASSLSGIQLANIMSFFIASISWRSPWSVTFFADLALKRCVQSIITHVYVIMYSYVYWHKLELNGRYWYYLFTSHGFHSAITAIKAWFTANDFWCSWNFAASVTFTAAGDWVISFHVWSLCHKQKCKWIWWLCYELTHFAMWII